MFALLWTYFFHYSTQAGKIIDNFVNYKEKEAHKKSERDIALKSVIFILITS
jgi:hypothetical protein